MKLGVISDTHTNTIDEIPVAVRKALVDVDLIVHAGDFTHMTVLAGLLEIGQVKAVWGNMDSGELKRLLPEKDVFESSLITHSHILGAEGTALQARAVAMAENPKKYLDFQYFVSYLLDFTTQDDYRTKIKKFGRLLEHLDDKEAVVRELGHGIEAFNSVTTAIFSFLADPKNFKSTIVYTISLEGDTDTIASMAGGYFRCLSWYWENSH